jgi:TonB family protein
VIFQPSPEYSDDARKARIEGAVEMLAFVQVDGTARIDHITKALGYGLDQKAMDAVRKWRFRPGTKDGIPAEFPVLITVNFSIR